MATLEEVENLRLLVDIPSADEPYTDEYLGALLDEWGTDSAAVILWRQKAASYSSLVDMSESGSSRKLSQLRDAALEMAAHFQNDSTAGATPFTVPIERP